MSTIIYSSSSLWPLQLVADLDPRGGLNQRAEDRYRTFEPQSDFLVLHSSLPRLFVKVQSKYSDSRWPKDLIQMVLQAQAIVRLANTFLDKFKEKKNFVLFAIYIEHDGTAVRYSFFEGNESVSTSFIYRSVCVRSLSPHLGGSQKMRI